MKIIFAALPLALTLAPTGARAQRALSVAAFAQVNLSQARFADDGLVNARVSLPPGLHPGYGLGLVWQHSPRTEVQAAFGYAAFGITVATQLDYVRQRRRNANTVSFGLDAFQVSAVVRRLYPDAEKPGHAWFAEVGAEALLGVSGGGTLGFANYDRNEPNGGPGLTGTGTRTGGRSLRPGLLLGVGRKWSVSPRSALALQLSGCLGLRDYSVYRLRTTVWEQGRDVDAVAYTNTLATRASYIGVKAVYFFRLR
jgi:hypothetical protein